MNVRVLLGLALALLLALFLAPPALAKSPPDKLAVEGPGLAAPVEITDAVELSPFSPWGRGFIDWERGPVTAPPPGGRAPYTASFYLEACPCDEEVLAGAPAGQSYTVSFFLGGRKIYVVQYVPAPSGAAGYIYIPGPGDPDHQLNIGTIIGASSSDRWDPDGRWQHATAEWDAAIQRALRVHTAIPTAPAPTGGLALATAGPGSADTAPMPGALPLPTVLGPPLWPVVVPASGRVSSLAWVAWRRRHRPTD